LLTGEGTYVIRYNKSIDNSAYLYLPNAAAGVNPLEYQDIPTPTTILLAEQGIINISSWTYYDKDLSNAIALSLMNGTLTTVFDVSYAATTNFTYAFGQVTFPFVSRMKAFPRINSSNGTNFYGTWINTLISRFPTIDISKGTQFNYAWNIPSLVEMPLLNPTQPATFSNTWDGDALLSKFPTGFFDNAKTTNYTNAFRNCALTQASVDNILVSIAQSVVNTPTLTNGTLNMTGGTSATPSATGLAAKAALVAAGWTVTNN
jgi:hypothetical protein